MEINFTVRFYGNDQELEKIMKDFKLKNNKKFLNELTDIAFKYLFLVNKEFEATILDYNIGINWSDLKSKSYVNLTLNIQANEIYEENFLIEQVIINICDYYEYNYNFNKFSYSAFDDCKQLPIKINFYYSKDKKTYSFFTKILIHPIDFYDYINKEFSHLSNRYLDFEKIFFFIKSKSIEEVKDTYKTFSTEQLQNFDEWIDIFFNDREFIIDSFIPWMFDQAETYETRITDKGNLNKVAKLLKDTCFEAYSCKIKFEELD